MYLGRLAAVLMTRNTTFQLECSACGRDWRTCPTDNVLSTDHIHVPCTLLFAHVAHSSREDIHVHVQSEGEEASGVVADHSKGQDTTIAIQTEADEDAITVSWQVPRHNDVGGAHILHRHSIKSIRCWGKRMTSHNEIAHNHITHTCTCIIDYIQSVTHTYTRTHNHTHMHTHTHAHTHMHTHTCPTCLLLLL